MSKLKVYSHQSGTITITKCEVVHLFAPTNMNEFHLLNSYFAGNAAIPFIRSSFSVKYLKFTNGLNVMEHRIFFSLQEYIQLMERDFYSELA